MWSLLVFNSVYRLESVKSCWYFRPSLVNYCPSNLLFRSPPPPLPPSRSHSRVSSCVGNYILLSLILGFWPDSEPAKLLHHPKPKPRRVGGLRQINTCRKDSLQGNFFITTFGIAFYQAIFLRCAQCLVFHFGRCVQKPNSWTYNF